ncbi:uncharacterized protein FIESC28_11166 [Fusarium coffeatum]|uniref:Uncharacterized protein n=1 Tax=Fusarium coffeatum TaxID=231269 RepID=A0A366QMJ7_9HYPO|nr:uncharacterized protein FIESC28_11166 [Fusarium coffeatum]RBR06151.1 hypothetical protein FIESC28_11166 [Fusarium coffeatum]
MRGVHSEELKMLDEDPASIKTLAQIAQPFRAAQWSAVSPWAFRKSTGAPWSSSAVSTEWEQDCTALCVNRLLSPKLNISHTADLIVSDAIAE